MGNPSKGKTHQKIFLKDDDKPSTICSPQEPITMSQDVSSTNETLEWFLLQDDASTRYETLEWFLLHKRCQEQSAKVKP